MGNVILMISCTKLFRMKRKNIDIESNHNNVMGNVDRTKTPSNLSKVLNESLPQTIFLNSIQKGVIVWE
jgi:hypothetical protein